MEGIQIKMRKEIVVEAITYKDIILDLGEIYSFIYELFLLKYN